MDPTKDLAWREALEFPEDWDVDFGEDQQDEEAGGAMSNLKHPKSTGTRQCRCQDELDDGFMEEDELGEKVRKQSLGVRWANLNGFRPASFIQFRSKDGEVHRSGTKVSTALTDMKT